MHTKENWFIFLPHGVNARHSLTVAHPAILSGESVESALKKKRKAMVERIYRNERF